MAAVHPIGALYDQTQPPGSRNWAADGRWVEIPSGFRWWRDEEDRIAGWPAGHLAAIHGWTHGLHITNADEWMALRKQKSEEVADFFAKNHHLFATPLRSLTGAEGTTFWDYQNVPLKVDVTDLKGRKVTFICKNHLQILNLAFAHYLTRSRAFKRRFGRFDPTRVNLVYRSGEGWLHQPLEGYVGYRHAELLVTYAPRGDGRDDDAAPESDNASADSLSDQERARARSRSPRR
jgi:hypothetical protein